MKQEPTKDSHEASSSAHDKSSRPNHIKLILAEEQRRGEILVGWVQMLIVAVLAGLYTASPKTLSLDSSVATHARLLVPIFLALYFGLTSARLYLAYRNRIGDILVAVSVIVDVGLLLALIWSFHVQYQQPASFYLKAPTFAYLFILIALRSLRLDPRPVLLSGLIAALGWLSLTLYAITDSGEVTRSYVRYMTSNAVLIGGEVDKIVSLVAITLILSGSVILGRRALTRQAEYSVEVGHLNQSLEHKNRELTAEISKTREYQAKLERVAYVDQLTGLGNRAQFLKALRANDNRISEADRRSIGVLLFDIDRFGNLTNTLGHVMGDMVLRSIGNRLCSLVRPEDCVARMGNDEFAVLIMSVGSREELAALAARLQSGLSAPIQLDGSMVELTASCGFVFPANEEAAEILRNAELALEQARQTGNGCRTEFEDAFRSRTETQFRLQSDIPAALKNNEFHLVYQPIMEAVTGRLYGFEALLRWQHPTKGPISPLELVSIAEATGQIHEIGAFVLREAAAQLSVWKRQHGTLAERLVMSVNVSPRQFDRPDDLLKTLKQLIAQDVLKPGFLKLEITESSFMEDPDRILQILQSISDLGIQLAIDDFGTGYSSFSLVRRLPVTTIKLDRSFIVSMETPGRAREIVKAIVHMSKRLGFVSVAEGVETERQKQLLLRLGCDLFQGYLFSRPLEPAAAQSLITGSVLTH